MGNNKKTIFENRFYFKNWLKKQPDFTAFSSDQKLVDPNAMESDSLIESRLGKTRSMQKMQEFNPDMELRDIKRICEDFIQNGGKVASDEETNVVIETKNGSFKFLKSYIRLKESEKDKKNRSC